jgi:hypothetical protein
MSISAIAARWRLGPARRDYWVPTRRRSESGSGGGVDLHLKKPVDPVRLEKLLATLSGRPKDARLFHLTAICRETLD